jgi:hypothetical protein
MIALAIDALKVAGLNIQGGAKIVSDWLVKQNHDGVRIRTSRPSTYSLPIQPWETVKNWREEIVRIAQGKGQYPIFIREIAADYMRQRERLPRVIRARRTDPKAIAVLLLKQMRPRSELGKTVGALLPNSR